MFSYFKKLFTKQKNNPREEKKIRTNPNGCVKSEDLENLGINIYQAQAKLLLTYYYHYTLRSLSYQNFDRLVYNVLNFFNPTLTNKQIDELYSRCYYELLVKHNLIDEFSILNINGVHAAECLIRQANYLVDSYLHDRAVFYMCLNYTPDNELLPDINLSQAGPMLYHDLTYKAQKSLTQCLREINAANRRYSRSQFKDFSFTLEPKQVLPMQKQDLGMHIFDAEAQAFLEHHINGLYVGKGNYFVLPDIENKAFNSDEYSPHLSSREITAWQFYRIHRKLKKDMQNQGLDYKDQWKRKDYLINLARCLVQQANYSIYGYLIHCYIAHKSNVGRSRNPACGGESHVFGFFERRISLVPDLDIWIT